MWRACGNVARRKRVPPFSALQLNRLGTFSLKFRVAERFFPGWFWWKCTKAFPRSFVDVGQRSPTADGAQIWTAQAATGKQLHVAAILGLCCCDFALCFTDKIHLEDVPMVPAIQPNQIITRPLHKQRSCECLLLWYCCETCLLTALVYPCTCIVFLCLNSLGEGGGG